MSDNQIEQSAGEDGVKSIREKCYATLQVGDASLRMRDFTVTSESLLGFAQFALPFTVKETGMGITIPFGVTMSALSKTSKVPDHIAVARLFLAQLKDAMVSPDVKARYGELSFYGENGEEEMLYFLRDVSLMGNYMNQPGTQMERQSRSTLNSICSSIVRDWNDTPIGPKTTARKVDGQLVTQPVTTLKVKNILIYVRPLSNGELDRPHSDVWGTFDFFGYPSLIALEHQFIQNLSSILSSPEGIADSIKTAFARAFAFWKVDEVMTNFNIRTTNMGFKYCDPRILEMDGGKYVLRAEHVMRDPQVVRQRLLERTKAINTMPGYTSAATLTS